MTSHRMLLIVLALAAGLVVGFMDSSPGWDSTGITAGLLLAASGAVAAIAGDRPRLWALLVGAPTPLLEIPSGGSTGAFAALVFAAIGATLGWAMGRTRPRAT